MYLGSEFVEQKQRVALPRNCKGGPELVGERITEAANYKGVRVRFLAYLGNAHIPMQVDIGFGDAVIPGPFLVCLPTILDFPPPELQGYSRESAIAEKLQAMVYLGAINSRMKDFYDVWSLADRFEFNGQTLSQAISETFHRRQTVLPTAPTAFSDAFAQNSDKQAQWEAFIRRHHIKNSPATLYKAVQLIAGFLMPVLQALAKEQLFDQHWSPGGLWI